MRAILREGMSENGCGGTRAAGIELVLVVVHACIMYAFWMVSPATHTPTQPGPWMMKMAIFATEGRPPQPYLLNFKMNVSVMDGRRSVRFKAVSFWKVNINSHFEKLT